MLRGPGGLVRPGRNSDFAGGRRTLALGAALAALLAAPAALAQADEFAPPPPVDAVAPAPARAPTAAPAAAPAATPAAAAAAAPAAAPAAPPEVGTADEAFDLKTKALEEQVNDLKEKIFRTKARLLSLSEAIIGNTVTSGAKLALFHRNELGSSYVLVSAAYTLDGEPLFTKVDETGDLNEREEFVFFDQRIVPGQHQMSVQYELRGHGYGIFAYLEGMRVKLRASYSFQVEPGKVTTIKSIVYEREGITLEFKDKPNIRFEQNVQKDVGKAQEQNAAAPQAPAGGVTPAAAPAAAPAAPAAPAAAPAEAPTDLPPLEGTK
jgi:hypothetical protein